VVVTILLLSSGGRSISIIIISKGGVALFDVEDDNTRPAGRAALGAADPAESFRGLNGGRAPKVE